MFLFIEEWKYSRNNRMLLCNVIPGHFKWENCLERKDILRYSIPWIAQITPLACELHWLPVWFGVQFKMLVFTFKALHGMEAGYLRVHVFLITSAHHMRSRRRGMLQFLSGKSYMWWDPEDEPFLLWCLPHKRSSRPTIIPKVRWYPSLLIFLVSQNLVMTSGLGVPRICEMVRWLDCY